MALGKPKAHDFKFVEPGTFKTAQKVALKPKNISAMHDAAPSAPPPPSSEEEGEEAMSAQEKAAQLKSRGNDAFGTGDYARALSLYGESMRIDGASESQAKVYANAAAALCKLNMAETAAAAAERATVLDPGWAKGWWPHSISNSPHRRAFTGRVSRPHADE